MKIARPNRPLADVNVLPQPDDSQEIIVSFMPDYELIYGEGDTRAYIALDASLSLKKMYGFGGVFGGDPNYVQGVAQKLGNLLSSITRSNKTSAIYWAVSPNGSKIEEIGEYNEQDWITTSITGPVVHKWGRGTKLLPAIQYGFEKVGKGAKGTVGVILTDGFIEDEQDCINYCLNIGKSLISQKPEPFKLILIGIGEEVDQGQLERFDNLFEGTGIDYDLFSSGMVASMQNEADILGVVFGELMSSNIIISATGRVKSGSGHLLAEWKDGMPGKFRFLLPSGETKFIIHTPSQDISQDISEVLASP